MGLHSHYALRRLGIAGRGCRRRAVPGQPWPRGGDEFTLAFAAVRYPRPTGGDTR